MRSSILLVATGALVVSASPILRERALVTDIVTEVVTVTVLADQPASTNPPAPPAPPAEQDAAPAANVQPAPATDGLKLWGGDHPRPVTSDPVVVPAPAVQVAHTDVQSDTHTESQSESHTQYQSETHTEYHHASASVHVEWHSGSTPATQPVPAQPAPVPSAPAQPAPVQPAPVQPAPATVEAPKRTPAALPEATDYQSTAIKHHNLHRSNHSADAVTWSDNLAASAQNLANKCVFKHETDGFGQNIAMWGSSRGAADLGAMAALARSVTDQWYDSEFELYAPNWRGDINMATFESWGHFSQVLWKTTKEVGCASTLCPSGTMVNGMDSWFTVCNYFPAGNMANEYQTNVGLPLGQANLAV